MSIPHSRHRKNPIALLATILAACLVLVGCSGGGDSEPPAPESVISSGTLEIANGTVKVDLLNVNWDAQASDGEPTAGNRFMTATFRIENQSADQFVAYDSILFEYYAADGSYALEAISMVEDDLIEAPPVDQGKSVTGAVVFEIAESIAPGGGQFELTNVDNVDSTLTLAAPAA